ncbi:hypothetical protein BJQ97_03430 [Geobacillus sp. TFV-3]|nr:hypothetical protein BJQ97_03430 [Geobacillus sp. TFV-3]
MKDTQETLDMSIVIDVESDELENFSVVLMCCDD